MKKILKIALIIIVGLALFVRFVMPTILHKAGLHATYADAKEYDLKGKSLWWRSIHSKHRLFS